MRLIRWLLLAALLGAAGGLQAAEVLKLLPRSHETLADPGLTQSEWRWLREHRTLRLAVWLPMSPPYDITTGLSDYGGINADFLGLIASNLGIGIEVVRYPRYADALAALRAGSADFIAQAGDNQRADGLLLSAPYSPSRAVEVLNTEAPEGSAVTKIASAASFPLAQVLARYPGAVPVAFSTSRHALEALAFRKIDLFFCDEVTARYLVSQSNLSNLRIRPLARPFPASGFAFAALAENGVWITIVNRVLKTLPGSAGVEIHRRWNGGIPLSLSEQRPVYTSLERKWVRDHPLIRVAVAEENAPVAWFSDGGQLRGIIADILTALRPRTGFRFAVQRYPSQRAALEAVKKGRADLVAGGVQEDIWQEGLITTRTWLYNSWVMVGREHHRQGAINPAVVSLDGQSPEAWLRQQSGEINRRVDRWAQGLAQVAGGESDMMTMPLIVANAALAGGKYDGLRILASVDIEPMRYSFGAARGAWPLIGILNKALINIPPEDLHALTRGGGADSGFMAGRASGGLFSHPAVLAAAAGLLLALALWLVRILRRRARRRLLAAIPWPLYICDGEDRIRLANPALCRALALSRAQIEGTRLSALPDGLRRWRAPLGDGAIGGWLDLSREAALIARLRQRQRRAAAASRAKSQFLTTMSHEIRTPLSAVIGLLELVMKHPEEREKNPQLIATASDAARSLQLLVGNILDVARIESGRLVLRPERVALKALVAELAQLFEGLAAQKGLQFILELDPGLQDDVLADRSRLRQMLVNITGNAVKYARRGEVILRVYAEARQGDALQLRAEVQDSGPGIDEATRATLFRPFAQGEGESVAQGSGLGLYICRRLAQMMGGSIALHSVPGEGTLVTLRLMLPVMAAQPLPAAAPPQADGPPQALTLLVVDDNPAGQLLLVEQLRRLGHRACGAQSAEEALQALAAGLPDVLIADCNLPGMSGLELARAVGQRYPTLAVFGITADARESVRRAALEAGMRECLFKPVTLQGLAALLRGERPVRHDAAGLPSALLEGDNLVIFLNLQIGVIDDTLAALSRWRDAPGPALTGALHRLRGGIQLLGVPPLLALCEAQEQAPDAAGLAQIAAEITRLRALLVQWRDSGLRPAIVFPTAQ